MSSEIEKTDCQSTVLLHGGWMAWCSEVEKAEGQRTVLLHKASQRGVSWDFLNKRKSDLLICPYISDLSYPVSADLAPRV